MTLTGLTGTKYTLDPVPIGSGGEGDVYRVLGGDGKVAKLYKLGALTQELVDKLMVMIENPPNDSVLSQVAWPLDLVGTEPGTSCGFVMPELSINAELGEVYKYPATLPISMHQKINIAQNICVVISEVHKAGYVFGDFNPRNIGLDKNTGLVSFLDTDTYHVEDKDKGTIYRCNVCASGYAAPELLEKCSDYVAEVPAASKNAYAETPIPTFTKETDNFALAIHIFKLLMNGYTPYGGIIETASVSQSSPGVGDAAVRRNSYCFKPGFKHQSAAILPLETLPEEIADLFTRAFIEGRADPRRRPNAVEWHEALCRYEQSLVNCSGNPLHQYDRKNSNCPLCEADQRYAAVLGDPQPSAQLMQKAYVPTPERALNQQASAPTTMQPKGTQNKKKRTGLVAVLTLVAIAITVLIVYMSASERQNPETIALPGGTDLSSNQISDWSPVAHVPSVEGRPFHTSPTPTPTPPPPEPLSPSPPSPQPPSYIMPDLFGMHYAEAIYQLVRLDIDLDIREEEIDSEIERGQVIDIVPSAGNELLHGDVVVIFYSLGPALVEEQNPRFDPYERGNTVGNNVNGGHAAIKGDLIYYRNSSDGGKLYVMHTDGSDKRKLNDDISSEINVVGDRVYYRNGSDGTKIYSINIDGSDRQKLNDDRSSYITVIGDRIYYRNDSFHGHLYTMNTDGSGRRVIIEDSARSINVIGDRIYYTSYYSSERISTIRTDGSSYRVFDRDSRTWCLVVVGEQIYYIRTDLGNDSGVFRMYVDGSGLRQLYGPWSAYIAITESQQINIVGERIYFSNRSDEMKLYSMLTDGTDLQKLNDDETWAINVVGNRIYYMNRSDDNNLYTMFTDGSGRRLVD